VTPFILVAITADHLRFGGDDEFFDTA